MVLQEKIIITQNIRVTDRYENLSPKEYLDLIRPYLRDLINNHKASMESSNNNNNNNSNNSNTDRAEWKI